MIDCVIFDKEGKQSVENRSVGCVDGRRQDPVLNAFIVQILQLIGAVEERGIDALDDAIDG